MKEIHVTIRFQSFGEVVLTLCPEAAPETCANFVCLIKDGYYDQMAIVRNVPNRLIQSGDPEVPPAERTDDTPGYALPGEFNRPGFHNPLTFKRGSLGMAMAADMVTPYATAGSFFIMTRDEPALDHVVPAFGWVVAGMDVVDRINQLPTHNEYGYDAPYEPVLIEEIEVDGDLKPPQKVPLEEVANYVEAQRKKRR